VPLSFGRPKTEDVVTLITEKRYGQAIELLRAQLKKRGASTTLRKQLADVLVLSGKKSEAIDLLIPLSDQFAREGFAAKAVSILKKIQKIDPGRRDVDERLARLIEEKQREAALPLRGPEIGLEEIAIEAPFSGPIDIPVATPAPEPPPEPLADEPEATLAPPAEEPPPTPIPEPQEEEIAIALPPPDDEAPIPMPAPAEPAPTAGDGGPGATASSVPVAAPDSGVPGIVEPEETGIEDYDLLYVPDDGEDEEEVVPLGEVVASPEESPEEVMSDGAFSNELMSLVDSVFQEAAEGACDVPEPASQAGPQRTGDQIVVSPLFRDFSVDEMVAVIQGLKLLSFERGDVIIREGQPGGSLFMLTSGRVRAFRKEPGSKKQIRIADLHEGAFFGEISMLTGQPRNASVVALNRCELLELDRPTLDEITRTHPHVWDVLREFAEKRSQARA
jgi:hypothetical protein